MASRHSFHLLHGGQPRCTTYGRSIALHQSALARLGQVGSDVRQAAGSDVSAGAQAQRSFLRRSDGGDEQAAEQRQHEARRHLDEQCVDPEVELGHRRAVEHARRRVDGRDRHQVVRHVRSSALRLCRSQSSRR